MFKEYWSEGSSNYWLLRPLTCLGRYSSTYFPNWRHRIERGRPILPMSQKRNDKSVMNQTREDNDKSYCTDLHLAKPDCLRDVAFYGKWGNWYLGDLITLGALKRSESDPAIWSLEFCSFKVNVWTQAKIILEFSLTVMRANAHLLHERKNQFRER